MGSFHSVKPEEELYFILNRLSINKNIPVKILRDGLFNDKLIGNKFVDCNNFVFTGRAQDYQFMYVKIMLIKEKSNNDSYNIMLKYFCNIIIDMVFDHIYNNIVKNNMTPIIKSQSHIVVHHAGTREEWPLIDLPKEIQISICGWNFQENKDLNYASSISYFAKVMIRAHTEKVKNAVCLPCGKMIHIEIERFSSRNSNPSDFGIIMIRDFLSISTSIFIGHGCHKTIIFI